MREYVRLEGYRCGGISAASLTEAGNISGVRITDDGMVALVMKAGTGFAPFEFGEGGADYSESVRHKDGIPFVTHRLKIRCENGGGRLRKYLGELALSEGVAALITTNEGFSLLVGYSECLGSEMPLRLAGDTFSSGTSRSDISAGTILLECTDDVRAYVVSEIVYE